MEGKSETVAWLGLGAAVTAVLVSAAAVTTQSRDLFSNPFMQAAVVAAAATALGSVVVLVSGGRRLWKDWRRKRAWRRIEEPGWRLQVVKKRATGMTTVHWTEWDRIRPQIRVARVDDAVSRERLRIRVVGPDNEDCWEHNVKVGRSETETASAQALFPDDFSSGPPWPLRAGVYEVRVFGHREDDMSGEMDDPLLARTTFEVYPDRRLR